MRIRVVSWNVDSRPTGLLDAKIDLLRRLQPDIALLQEINRPVYRALLPHPSAHERMHRKSRLFSWGTLSTDVADPRGSEYRLGCAVLGVPTTALLDAHVLDKAPFDVSDPARPGLLWRTVAARVALSSGQLLTACSFHARPRASAPAVALQRAFHTGIANWLAEVSGPVIFGIDRGVDTDYGDPLDGKDPLVGPEPVHGLTGVLIGDRDQVWATPDFEVLDSASLADDALAAGSDHPVLLVDLALRAP
ncbi:MAG: hypothetical protein ACRDTC_25350 [Pseudonocardiaceae bacterium]